MPGNILAYYIKFYIHHIFRLGPALILPTAVGLAVPIVLWALYARSGKPALLWAYGAYAGLVFCPICNLLHRRWGAQANPNA